MRHYKHLEGKVFGRLTVIERAAVRVTPKGQNRTFWRCKCSCGETKEVSHTSLMNGYTKSCGCYTREAIGTRARKHGKSKSAIWNTWMNMRARCSPRGVDTKTKANYYDRGIRVCEEWKQSFEAFYADMGDQPGPEYTIERIDNNGNYEPGNCRWATMKEQAANRRSNLIITSGGVSMIASQWAEKLGIKQATLSARMRVYNWTNEEALYAPHNAQINRNR